MYQSYFQLKERPFKLVPDPAYLFLSRTHEEALAHLSYAVDNEEGFVEITGEIGTGKTTLCRTFLENLDAKSEAAYIFNPKLDALQLLKAINDEFTIASDGATIKELVDALNTFLIDQKRAGKRVMLLIDEAHNLSKDVLEQIRLLSNLETSRSKLLQIILVGQPELRHLLDAFELRQLRQRITLNCRLQPLSFDETCRYVRHRLQIAALSEPVKFDHHALCSIYDYSGGVPRLINTVCDRALVTAYGSNQRNINGPIVKAAIRELGHHKKKTWSAFFHRPKVGWLIWGLLGCVVLSAALLFRPTVVALQKLWSSTAPTAPPAAPATDLSKGQGQPQRPPVLPTYHKILPPAKAPAATPPTLLDIPLSQPAPALMYTARRSALAFALRQWDGDIEIASDLDQIQNDLSYFRLAASQSGFRLTRIDVNWSLLMSLNLPGILEIHTPENQPAGYLTLFKIEAKRWHLWSGHQQQIVWATPETVMSSCRGGIYIPWKNFYAFVGIVPTSAPKDTIIALKMYLKELGFTHLDLAPAYDEATEATIKYIQKKNGLIPDGIVGALTQIILYNQNQAFIIPYLNQAQPGAPED